VQLGVEQEANMVTLLVFVSLATAAPGPRLAGPAAVLGLAESVVVTLSGGGGVHIDGCAPLELERKQGEAWVALPTTVCPKALPASRVDAPLTLTFPAVPAGEYRAVVGWGSGCTADQPFHLAGCRKFGTATSEPFFVGEAPPPAP
jgi:hypothetical protein